MYILTVCDTRSFPFNNDKKRVLALTLSHLEDLSILGSMGEPENEINLTGEMLSAVCRLFVMKGNTLKDQQTISRLICMTCHLQKMH